MNTTRKSIKTLLILAGLIAISGVLRVLFYDEHEYDNFSSFYLIVLGVLLIMDIDRMLVEGETKRNLLICVVWILIVLLIRGARYSVFRDQDQLMRYLWYFYYIPLLVIPYYSLRAAVYVGIPEEDKSKNKIFYFLEIICIFFSFFVLTNDYHQLIFKLHDGFKIYWHDEYSYCFFYWILYGWMYLLLVGSFGVLIYKCRISACRRYSWVPVIPIVIGTIWNSMIALGIAPKINNIQAIEFPETFAFMVGGTWLCCITIGLVPANKSYEELFHISNIGALITDNNGELIYRSANAVNQDHSSLDLIIRHEQINGGHVYWQSDVSEINRINEKLESIHQQLSEEAELIRMENELREKNAATKAKNDLYDAIAVRVLSQSKKIAELSIQAEIILENTHSQPDIQSSLQLICVHGSYIKRMANFMIIATQDKAVSQMELALAIAEILRQLNKMGIQTSINTDDSYSDGLAEDLAAAYEKFISYIEQSLPGLSGIYVTMKNDICKLTLEGQLPSEYKIPDYTSLEYDDEVRFVTIPCKGKG